MSQILENLGFFESAAHSLSIQGQIGILRDKAKESFL
jgi:hypothetical protein